MNLKRIINTNDKDYLEGVRILNKYMTGNASISSNELTYYIENYNKKFNDKFYCFVIKKDEKVIGWFQFVHFINKFIHVDYLVVDKDFRNADIFEKIIELLNSLKSNLIVLETANELPQHEAIVRLYKTFGFKVFDFEYKEPKANVDLINKKIDWLEVPSTLMYFGEPISNEDLLNELFFNHYLRWYKLYEIDLSDYALFLTNLKNSMCVGENKYKKDDYART